MKQTTSLNIVKTCLDKEFGDFQTPPALIADVLRCLNVRGENWQRVLEPTCGKGHFISGLLSLDSPHPNYGIIFTATSINLIKENLLFTKVN